MCLDFHALRVFKVIEFSMSMCHKVSEKTTHDESKLLSYNCFVRPINSPITKDPSFDINDQENQQQIRTY